MISKPKRKIKAGHSRSRTSSNKSSRIQSKAGNAPLPPEKRFRLIGDELVLQGTDIPQAWSNILGCEKSFSLINAYGQGLAVDRTPSILHYLTGKRYFYVQDSGSGAFFSPLWFPVMAGVESYEVRMHPAYSAFHAQSAMNVTVDTRVVVDPRTGRECWSFNFVNTLKTSRSVGFTAVVPFAHMKTLGQRCFFDAQTNAILREMVPFFGPEVSAGRKNIHYVCANRKPQHWCTSYATAMPFEETAQSPWFLKGKKFDNADTFDQASCAAMTFTLELGPGKEKQLSLEIGVSTTLKACRDACKEIDAGKALDAAMKLWRGWQCPVNVTLPHAELSAFMNTWAKHQIRMNCETARWSLAPATRNWAIDWQAAAYLRPNDAIAALKTALAAQKNNGFVPQGFTLGDGGKLVDMHTMDFRDAAVWLPFFAQTLCETTGDPSFLSDKVPYAGGGEATVLEHLIAGIKFLHDNRGVHELVLIGEGDWNDLLNNVGKKGKGESVWLSCAHLFACKNLIDLCAWAAQPGPVGYLEQWYDTVAAALNRSAWDGAWYWTAITDYGNPVGSSRCDEGKIFIIPQAWAVMADAVPRERLDKVLDSVRKRLYTFCGALLHNPPYTKYSSELGRLTACLPGLKENGAAYCAGTLFHVFALYCAGKPDEAYNLLLKVLPGNPDNHFVKSTQNPAYIPNSYLGPAAGRENAGRGSNHNWTGAAPWLFWIVLRELLGIKGTREGISIKPHLPDGWENARCDIDICGVTLHIDYCKGDDKGVFRGEIKLADDVLKNTEKGAVYDLKVVF